jgi:HD-GYP domain-containing protein (c-di-GMP phosphodiesterase class II)
MQNPRHTMRIERLTIEANNATIGMYVSKLDRPWLETPFVFQGFEIRDREELDMLQRYCSTITVDVYRGSLTPVEIRSLLATQSAKSKPAMTTVSRQREPGKLARWLRNFLLRHRIIRPNRRAPTLEADGYPVTTTVRGEARPAFNAYARLCRTFDREALSAKQRGKLSRRTLDKAVGPVIDSILRHPDAMAWTVFSRRQTSHASGRAVGTAVWCVIFGRQLGFERQQLEELALGGLLLDIGKIRLPPDLIEREGDLPPEQMQAMKRHVDHSLDIVHRSGAFGRTVVDMVENHHERADGSGYPAGRSHSAIPPFARIAGIADAFDAMTTANPYSPAYAAFDVARMLNEARGKTFDAEVVDQFLRAVGMFPTASVVELSDGTVGLVVEQNRSNALRPKVMLLLDRDHQPLAERKIIELRDLPPDATHANAVWIAQGHPHGAFGIDPMDHFQPSMG